MTPPDASRRQGGLRWLPPELLSRTTNAGWNGLARLWQAGVQLAFVPVYIALLGHQAYGLVVLNATLVASLTFLDHLTSPVLARELSRHDGTAENAERLRGLVATLERFSIGAALAAAAAAFVAAPLFTAHWRGAGGLPVDIVSWSFIWMAAALAAQWPGFLYAAGMAGLQRQGLLAASRIFWVSVQYGGGALALLAIDRTPVVLFAWLALTFSLQTLVQRWVLHKVMPPASAGRFEPAALRGVLGFAGGTMAVGILTAIIAQLDKFVVASLFTPEQFAAYGLAFAIATQFINLFTGPFGGAVLPQASYLLSTGRMEELSASYTRWRQALLIVNVAASFLIVIFADTVLSAWLGSGSFFAREVAAIMPIFIAGSMIGGAIVVPNALLYARGDFRLIYLASAAYIVLFVLVLAVARPADYRHYAYAWIAFNLISACVIVP
ncbi:MAG: lipopolysaccharide biosynthesis protein, partial [Beijerinckiaceae bacterium]